MTTAKTATITGLLVENTKRIKAVKMSPSPSGLTIIGGKNGQGKTSVLDAIAWALGGERKAPSSPRNAQSSGDPHIDITLSNGLHITRSGKNSSLKVTDKDGLRGGQQILTALIGELALDLPKFMSSNPKEKAQKLLEIIGVGDALDKIDTEEKQLCAAREEMYKHVVAKEGYAASLPEYPDVQADPVSVSDLVRRQREIIASNAANEQKRNELDQLREREAWLVMEMQRLEDALTALKDEHGSVIASISEKSCYDELQDVSTSEIERMIDTAEEINACVAANKAKASAIKEAADYRAEYDAKTATINGLRKKRVELLNGADLPLPELSVENGELLYDGKGWDCMSSAEQLRVSVAIVRRLKPECGFVLVDKLEQMDLDTLNEFNAWLESESLQVIATRVSTGDECSIIIEDGLDSHAGGCADA